MLRTVTSARRAATSAKGDRHGKQVRKAELDRIALRQETLRRISITPEVLLHEAQRHAQQKPDDRPQAADQHTLRPENAAEQRRVRTRARSVAMSRRFSTISIDSAPTTENEAITSTSSAMKKMPHFS